MNGSAPPQKKFPWNPPRNRANFGRPTVPPPAAAASSGRRTSRSPPVTRVFGSCPAPKERPFAQPTGNAPGNKCRKERLFGPTDQTVLRWRMTDFLGVIFRFRHEFLARRCHLSSRWREMRVGHTFRASDFYVFGY